MFTPGIYMRIQNGKIYFEIAALLNFKQGTSRARKFYQKQKLEHISDTGKYNITFSFHPLDIPCLIGRKEGKVNIIFPIL